MTTRETTPLLRRLPKVDRLLASEELRPAAAAYPRPLLLRAVRETLADLRARARAGTLEEADLAVGAVRRSVEERLEEAARPYYRRVVNATGVILHTGLGRAPLPPEVASLVGELSHHPQRVEISLETGERGGRDLGCARLLQELIGCEAATVVNNNAAATMLILAALARGKKVLLSRGEMVEIGGSFRVPDVMRESGCTLVDVGTTNRTHEGDYRSHLDEETGMILKVHTSNYRVVGFTHEVDVAGLVRIGAEAGVPVVHDLGSGCMVDLAAHGRPGEEMVRASVQAGADLVCFSGDKLLGGPQAGLIVGKKAAVERCRRHPLFRAFRPGRLVYTALEATLRIYLEGDEAALERIPVLRRLVARPAELRERAESLARRVEGIPGLTSSLVECTSQAGSGSLPAREYPSWGVRVQPADRSVEDLAAALRLGDPAVLTVVREDSLLFDVRTLDDEELDLVAGRLEATAPSG